MANYQKEMARFSLSSCWCWSSDSKILVTARLDIDASSCKQVLRNLRLGLKSKLDSLLKTKLFFAFQNVTSYLELLTLNRGGRQLQEIWKK